MAKRLTNKSPVIFQALKRSSSPAWPSPQLDSVDVLVAMLWNDPLSGSQKFSNATSVTSSRARKRH